MTRVDQAEAPLNAGRRYALLVRRTVFSEDWDVSNRSWDPAGQEEQVAWVNVEVSGRTVGRGSLRPPGALPSIKSTLKCQDKGGAFWFWRLGW